MTSVIHFMVTSGFALSSPVEQKTCAMDAIVTA